LFQIERLRKLIEVKPHKIALRVHTQHSGKIKSKRFGGYLGTAVKNQTREKDAQCFYVSRRSIKLPQVSTATLEIQSLEEKERVSTFYTNLYVMGEG